MTVRSTTILLIAAALGGVGIDDTGGPTVRQAASAEKSSETVDLGHPESDTSIVFEDITRESGLDALLDCMMVHSAAVGDADRDGFPDLFFGAFTAAGSCA